jgi:hypothetical protein
MDDDVLIFILMVIIIGGCYCYDWYQRTHKDDIGLKED